MAESVPQFIHTAWIEFVQQWMSLEQISFDRKILIDEHNDIQLHGFCDASINGYGACIYIRSRDIHGKTIVKLLCSKSRVAPLKSVTIPRLELNGAVLLTQLYQKIKDALNFVPNKIVFWSDSMIVLHWIKTAPHLLKTYVANRVVTIHEITKSYEWRHIRSEDSPADIISRGQLPQAFLRNQLWSSGPG